MFTNYRYVITPNKVIALSTYAGRTVRGIAKCHPNDVFDEEAGKALAAARCNEKIAAKRYARARKKYDETYNELIAFETKIHKVSDYLKDSYEAYKEAKRDVADFLSTKKS